MFAVVRNIPALHVTNEDHDPDSAEMVNLAVCASQETGIEELKCDLRRMLGYYVTSSMDALYKFIDTPTGLDLRFVLMMGRGEFVTGMFRVEIPAASR